MTIPYLQIVVLSVFAIFFYRGGRSDKSWGILWAALSIIASFAALWLFHSSMVAVLASQVLVFIGITAYRVLRAP